MAAGDGRPRETPQGWARIECESVLMVLEVLRSPPPPKKVGKHQKKGDTKLTVNNLLYIRHMRDTF